MNVFGIFFGLADLGSDLVNGGLNLSYTGVGAVVGIVGGSCGILTVLGDVGGGGNHFI